MTSPNLPRPSPDWAYFLDVDGTLLDIVERPNASRVSPGLRRLLAGLDDITGGALALITGRSVADIDRLFAPSTFCVAGQHGAERRGADGRLHRQRLPDERLRKAEHTLRRMVVAHPDLVLEDKGMSLALHYRSAPELGAEVRKIMRGVLEDVGEEFEMLTGKMVVEIKPGGRDKGTAIAEFMKEPPFRSRMPVFIGDDVTDEFGFELVNQIGGHCVKVGEGGSAAHLRLPHAGAVRAWLGEIANQGRQPGDAVS